MWSNCLTLTRNIGLMVTLFFKVDNYYADKLPNIRLSIVDNVWYYSCPMVVKSEFIIDFYNLEDDLFVPPPSNFFLQHILGSHFSDPLLFFIF